MINWLVMHSLRLKILSVNVTKQLSGVEQLYQKHGIGMALVNATEAWSINHDIRRIEASVVPENARAVELFKAAGFNIEGELRISFTLMVNTSINMSWPNCLFNIQIYYHYIIL